MTPPSPTRRSRPVGAIVINAVAILAAIAAFPYLLMPLLKLGFVGLLAAAPVAVVVYFVLFVVIDVAPIIGLLVSAVGASRWVGWITGPLSLASLVGLVGLVAVLKTQIDVDGDGRSHAPASAGCKRKTTDGSALGRPCDADAGEAPTGNCPPEYWCMERVVDHPETNQCMIYCSNECECPARHECIFNKCVKR